MTCSKLIIPSLSVQDNRKAKGGMTSNGRPGATKASQSSAGQPKKPFSTHFSRCGYDFLQELRIILQYQFMLLTDVQCPYAAIDDYGVT